VQSRLDLRAAYNRAMLIAFSALLLVILLALVAVLRAAARHPESRPSAEHIDALLPQTQCTRCGYPTCGAYAAAIARGEARINRCPPGGAAGIRALAVLTGQPVQPLDPDCGEETPPRVAIIREDICIGCTKCIQACPVDAIVGAAKLMHTVIPQLCTGCELCIPPCPVDCIDMVPAQPNARDAARSSLPHAA
jgi:electron transport complex protein RnfB